jgi:hypothetical protein
MIDSAWACRRFLGLFMTGSVLLIADAYPCLRSAPTAESTMSRSVLHYGSTTSQVDYAQTIQSYVKVLEKYVLRYPDQWNGWMRHLRRDRNDVGRQLS